MPARDAKELPGASFHRGLRVLASVAEAGEIRADEIARESALPLSTVYRYLKTLREVEFIEERDGSYVPGWRLLELSGQHLTHTKIVELGHSFLRELSETTGETAVITVRVGTQAMCLRQVESHHPVRVAFRINQLLPLHAGAGQRMLLAHAPPTVVERVLEQPLRHITTATLDRAEVVREIDQIRRNGFLISHGEISDGALAVAAPVFANGEIACALTVAGPENRCSRSWITRARAALRASSLQLGEALEQRPRRGAEPAVSPAPSAP